jgi:uncharacterized protein with HEPN domain
MSDDRKVQREWRFYLDDMATFAKKIQTYTHDLTQTQFVANELTYDATLRNLELIGEAATHIPAEIREANPEIPWRLIIATHMVVAVGTGLSTWGRPAPRTDPSVHC